MITLEVLGAVLAALLIGAFVLWRRLIRADDEAHRRERTDGSDWDTQDVSTG